MGGMIEGVPEVVKLGVNRLFGQEDGHGGGGMRIWLLPGRWGGLGLRCTTLDKSGKWVGRHRSLQVLPSGSKGVGHLTLSPDELRPIAPDQSIHPDFGHMMIDSPFGTMSCPGTHWERAMVKGIMVHLDGSPEDEIRLEHGQALASAGRTLSN
jgi:hypothetical protein